MHRLGVAENYTADIYVIAQRRVKRARKQRRDGKKPPARMQRCRKIIPVAADIQSGDPPDQIGREYTVRPREILDPAEKIEHVRQILR